MVGRAGVSARRRVTMSAVVGAVAGALCAPLVSWELSLLVGYDVAALTFLVGIWRVVWPLDAGQTAADAEREDPTRAGADLMLVSAALASLAAVGTAIVRANGHGSRVWVQVGFGVVSVLVSWAVIHTVYALRYAKIFYTGPDGGANFHTETPPRFSDFAYLAFTIGMTFQVSDTELNNAEFRRQVLRHSLLSYLFGTVIVALTINLIAGLTR